MSRPAAFFDRDGVINVDHGYVGEPARFDLIDGVAEALILCRDAGYLLFVVTNQSGVARGYFDEAAVREVHRHMEGALAARGVLIDDIRYCPHLEGGEVAAFAQACECRKPAPGMLTSLIEEWDVDLTRSFMIGDKQTDVEAARRAGVAGYLFEGGAVTQVVQRALDAAGRA